MEKKKRRVLALERKDHTQQMKQMKYHLAVGLKIKIHDQTSPQVSFSQ